jgi:hypothetical protein
MALLQNPTLNKGTAFSAAERDALGLRGLLPPRITTPEQQVQRVLENFGRKADPLEKYINLAALHDRNETLFFRVIVEHPDEMMGNNSYIFPGVGLGAIVARARHVTDEMFMAAVTALGEQVSDADLAQGSLYPPLARVREVSAYIAAAVARVAFERGLAGVPRPADLLGFVRARMYEPVYCDYAAAG